MKPGPIPDQFIWPGAKLIIFDAPEGHDQRLLEILPVTGLVDKAADNVDRVHFLIKVDDRDLELLRERGWFWLVMYGHVVPFDVGHPEVEDWIEVEDHDQKPGQARS